MKKIIIGGLVGGLLIFVWQTLSWPVMNLHQASQQYTPKQDSILSYLNQNLKPDNGYLLPSEPLGTSFEQASAMLKAAEGKPWAQITYHAHRDINMGKSAAINLVGDMVEVMLLCFIITAFKNKTFGNILLSAVFTGLIAFFFGPFTNHCWYPVPDIAVYLLDAIAAWTLAGIWLGWYLKKEA